jgi:hypothetical protein
MTTTLLNFPESLSLPADQILNLNYIPIFIDHCLRSLFDLANLLIQLLYLIAILDFIFNRCIEQLDNQCANQPTKGFIVECIYCLSNFYNFGDYLWFEQIYKRGRTDFYLSEVIDL